MYTSPRGIMYILIPRRIVSNVVDCLLKMETWYCWPFHSLKATGNHVLNNAIAMV